MQPLNPLIPTCAAVLIALGTLACGDGDDGAFDFAGGTGEATAGGQGPGDDGASSDSAGTAADDTGGAESGGDDNDDNDDDDGGSESGSDEGDTGDDLPIEPCTGIDVLFVVDNSGTMLEEQARIAAAAATWLQTLDNATATAANNLHVGVITTDESAMVTQTAEPCGFASGLPYMQTAGKTFSPKAFTAEVQCALTVGVDGSTDERPMQHMLEALSPEFIGTQGANEGFLRDDALLVVVLVTDEEDDYERKTQWGSPGDPADWTADLAALKGDLAKDIVVLSLIGLESPNACPQFQWDGVTGAELSPRLDEFTMGFPEGASSDVCALDYTPFLAGTIPALAGACGSYSPP